MTLGFLRLMALEILRLMAPVAPPSIVLQIAQLMAPGIAQPMAPGIPQLMAPEIPELTALEIPPSMALVTPRSMVPVAPPQTPQERLNPGKFPRYI
jgi:hypothetical protein